MAQHLVIMKKFFLTVTALLCLCQANHSQDGVKSYLSKQYDITGYRGFVEVGATTTALGNDDSLNYSEVYTSHGYQFNAHSFLGAGIGFVDESYMPIFVDYRYNILKGSIIPFIDAKAGYLFKLSHGLKGSGFCLTPSIGVKFMLVGKTAINLSLGYSSQYENDNTEKDYRFHGGLSYKVGFEF